MSKTVLLFAVLGAVYVDTTSGVCLSSQGTFNNICYEIFPNSLSADDAATDCESRGGQLADIESAAAKDAIIAYVELIDPGKNVVSDYLTIAINDRAIGGTYVNHAGVQITYTNWQSSQPNDDGDCARMSRSSSYEWYDYDCATGNPYLCQFKGSITLPTCVQRSFSFQQFQQTIPSYNHTGLTADICRYGCAEDSFDYAGIQGGDACYCSKTILDNTTETTCDATCSGSSDLCGGTDTYLNDAMYVMETPKLVTGLQLRGPNDTVVAMLEPVDFSVVVTRGEVDTYSYSFGDGLSLSTTANGTTHSYHGVGDIMTTVHTTDLEGNVKSTHIIVKVEMKASIVRFISPPQVPTETLLCFDVEIASGSDLALDIDFTDGQIVSYVLPDSTLEPVGPIWGVESTSTLSTSKAYLMINHNFQSDGTVFGWKYNAKTTGNVRFQVYRPSCTNGNEFCYRSYSCYDPLRDSCDRSATNFWSRTCSNKFSLSEQECTDSSGNRQDFYFTGTWGSMPHQNFVLVAEFAHEVTSVGLGWVTYMSNASDAIHVQRGDVMGVFMESAALHTTTGSGSYVSYYADNADPFSTSPSTTNGMIHLEALFVPTIKMKVCHTFEGAAFVANITATVKDTFESIVMDEVSIDVQEKIRNVTIQSEFAATTHLEFEFYIPEHYGNKVTYYITFGDLSDNSTMSRNFSHTYTEPGIYNVTVFAYNDVSNMSYTIWLPVQDAISELHVSYYPFVHGTIFGDDTAFFVWAQNGTNVTISMDMGDSNTQMFYHDMPAELTSNCVGALGVPEWLATFAEYLTYADANVNTNSNISGPGAAVESWINHTYITPSNFTVNITMFNLVSFETVILYIPNEIPIQELVIIQPKPIIFGNSHTVDITMANGTAVTFGSTFKGQPTRDFSMSWETLSGSVVLELGDYVTTGRHHLTVEGTNFVPPFYANYSIDFDVDYKLTDVECVYNTSHVRPYEVMGFNCTMSNGSRINVTVDFDDGTFEHFYFLELLRGDFFQFSHTFPSSRFYNIKIFFENPVGNETIEHLVTCQDPVVSINWTSNSPVSIYPTGYGVAMFNLTLPGSAELTMPGSNDSAELLPPTDPYYKAWSGYSVNGNHFADVGFQIDHNTIVKYNFSYMDYGTYNASINISNFVSHVVYSAYVLVDQPVLDLEVESDVYYVIFNQTWVTFMVTMSWGSRLNITWDWQDATKSDVAAYNRNGTNMKSHLYSRVGVYYGLITTSNSVGNVTTQLPKPVIVQHPVTDAVILRGQSSALIGNPHYWTVLTFHLFTRKDVPAPTNASFVADFMDGKKQGDTWIYDSDRDPSMDSTDYRHICSFSNNYTVGETYNISATVYNLVSNKTFYFPFRIVEAIRGLRKKVFSMDPSDSSLSNGTGRGLNYFPVEEEVHFIASTERASHVTYYWDFGDGQFATVYPDVFTTHKYEAPGTYTVKLNGSNPLTSATISRTIYIQQSISEVAIWAPSPMPRNRSVTYLIDPGQEPGTEACYFLNCKDEASNGNFLYFIGNVVQCLEDYPVLFNRQPRYFYPMERDDFLTNVAEGRTRNTTLSNTYQTVATFDITLRVTNQVSEQVVEFRQGVTRGPCQFPIVDLRETNKCVYPNCDEQQNKMYLKSVDVTIAASVNINCESTKIANYTWTLQKIDETTNTPNLTWVSPIPLVGVPLPALVFPKRMLDYGVYCATLNVSMFGENGIFNAPGPESSTCIRIIQSELQVSVNNRQYDKKAWGKNITLNVIDYSVDPDVEPDDKSGMEWTWSCKRACESWPIYDANYNIIEPMNTTCNYTNSTSGIVDRGCNMYDGYDSSGLLPNITGGRNRIDLGEYNELDNVLIQVCVYKDTRSKCFDHFLEIAEGDPPEISIRCISNCLHPAKINPLKKASNTAEITAARVGQKFVFTWFLSVADANQGYADAQEMPAGDWTTCTLPSGTTAGVSTGLSLGSISMDAYLLQCQDKNKKYFLTVQAYRAGGNPNNFGYQIRDLIINKPPLPGVCGVEPLNGTALDTRFNTFCTSDFVDEDAPLMYEIQYRTGLSGPFNTLGNAEFPKLVEGQQLPQGKAERDNQITVRLVATDAVGSSTPMDFFVQVMAPPAAQLQSMVGDVISGGGGVVADALAGGDSGAVCNVVGALSGTISSGENATSEESLKAIEFCATATAGLEVTSSNLPQIISANLAVSSNPSALSADATASAAASADKVADLLLSGGAGENTKEQLQNLQYITESGAQAGISNGGDPFAMQDVLSKGLDALASSMVPGENNEVISTGTSTACVGSQPAENLDGATFDSESASVGLGDPSGFIGEGNDTEPSLNVKVTASTDNVYGSDNSNSSSANGVQSMVVTFAATNASGYPIVGNAPLILDIAVPNPPAPIKVVRKLSKNPEEMVVNQISVTKKSAMFLQVVETFNTSTSSGNSTNNTNTTPYAVTSDNGTTTYTFFMTSTSVPPTINNDNQVVNCTATPNRAECINCTAMPNHTSCIQPVNCTLFPNHTDCVVLNCTNFPNHTDCLPVNCTQFPNNTRCMNTSSGQTTAAPVVTTTPTLQTTQATKTIEELITEVFEKNKKKPRFTMYISITEPPTVEKYDFKCTLPLNEQDIADETEAYFPSAATVTVSTTASSGVNVTTTPAPTTTESPAQAANAARLASNMGKRNLDSCLLNATLLGFTEADGMVYIGVMGEASNYTESNVTVETTNGTASLNGSYVNGTDANSTTVSPIGRRKRDVLLESAPRRERRADTEAATPDVSEEMYYEMSSFTAQCKYFNPYTNLWETEGCTVGPLTIPSLTQCICTVTDPPKPEGYVETVQKRAVGSPTTQDPNMIPPAPTPKPTAFGCGLGVPMNTINPSDSAFLKLDSNPVIFSVMVALICIYLTLLIWAKKADRVDDLKAATTPLLDNDVRHKYLYELTVYTGSKSRAGTTAKVSMIFSGEEDETNPRLIYDDKRKVLQTGGVDSFLMAVPRCLGPMSHIRVWHDNSGSNASWFFSRMIVKDLQTDERSFFILDKWLAVEEEDGLIDRIVPLAGKEELTNFNHLFWTKTKNDLSDGHIWFSVFGRPVKSTFTRAQRLTCCISLLFCTMMANILFYDTGGSDVPVQEFVVGPITFTIPALLTGVYSSLIVFPINLIIVMIFRYAKPPKTKWQKEKERAIAEAKRAQRKSAITAEEELRQQREFLETGDESKRLMMGSQSGISYIGSQDGEGKVKTTDRYEKKKGKFRLPHWVIYPNYFLCLATCGVAFYLTVEVGGVFGAKKSNEWMVSFVVSIIESIFFTQPIKVFGLALFFALVIKKPDVEIDDGVEEPGLGKGEEYLHKSETSISGEGDREFRKSLSKYKNIPLPPDEEYLKAARAQRMKEIQMQSLIMEIFVYMAFLYLLMMVGYGNRDPWANPLYQTIHKEFGEGAFSGSRSMHSVSDYAGFWDWANNTMVPALYGDTWYNNKDYWFQVGFFADRNNFIMGVPRLRQVRNKPRDCRMPVYKYQPECHDDYDINKEDQGIYHTNWVPVNTSNPDDIGHVNFVYRNSTSLDGYPTYGQIGYYGGGGFVVELTRAKEDAYAKISELHSENWIDQDTRAVFVEFVTYNPSLNLHGISFMVFEFLTTGGIYPHYKFYIMRLDRYVGAGMLAMMIAEFGAAAFTIYMLVRECRKIKKEKRAYFKDFWNTIEFGVTITMVVAIVMFVYRFVLSEMVQANYRDNKTSFHNFQYPAGWDEIYGYLIAFIIFANTLKFLKLLRFNKKMNMMGMTIGYAASPIMSFLVVLGVIFFAYAQMTNLIFGRVLSTFSSFIASCETLFSMMLNKFDFRALQAANPIFAPLVFFTFTVFISFMLINFLLTIILESFAVVKMDLARQENEFELVEFIVGRFKGMLGMSKGPGIAQTEQLTDSLHTKTRDVNRKLAEMMERVEDYIFTSGIDHRVIMDEIDTIEERKSQAMKKKIVSG